MRILESLKSRRTQTYLLFSDLKAYTSSKLMISGSGFLPISTCLSKMVDTEVGET